MHFEASVAASGIIAPKLFIHLTQNEQFSEDAILSPEMSFEDISERTAAYQSVDHNELKPIRSPETVVGHYCTGM